ncbi:aminodeoxychorismate synthase component I [Microbacterium awajiense]|uniref:Aminodeoxychorismate synthase component I n=1 Tax=Microbacterium awajiense TaxID=415214 RepID=A0ABP7A711_9MICO
MPEPLTAVAIDWCDPATVYRALDAEAACSFWLDAGPAAATGWSWVGVGVREQDPDAVGAVRVDASAARDDTIPGSFRGGWVGWLGYEDGADGAGAPTVPVDSLAGSRWMRTSWFVAFDHARRRSWIVAPADRAGGLADEVSDGCRGGSPGSEPAASRIATPRHAPDEYAALIERCRDAIREGDAYQLCLTTRFDVPGPVDATATYLRLREATPAHHGGLVRIDDVSILSASPERFLEVVSGVVRTSPIKGTRPRGEDAATDAALAVELVTSEKERAENVMIVDLMRNDLSRVCVPGTVAVDRLLRVESYPAVHQLVSTVSGTLAGGVDVAGLMAATFPAGSMTGAPKLSAMTILYELERGPRGIFSGCFGWVGIDGDLDLAMVIRTIVVAGDDAYVGAGGGITWRSEPWAEVAEVAVKAAGPLGALGAAVPEGWLPAVG